MHTRSAGTIARSLLVAGVVGVAAMPAHADLIGDFITGQIQGGPGAFQVVPPTATVGAGNEFNIEFVGTPSHAIDIGSTLVHVFSIFGQPISTGAGEVLVLGDLDGVNGNLEIVGITNFQTNESEMTISDVTFTANEVRINLSPTVWAADGFVSFDLVFIPAPSALALLGLAGVVSRRRRRR